MLQAIVSNFTEEVVVMLVKETGACFRDVHVVN